MIFSHTSQKVYFFEAKSTNIFNTSSNVTDPERTSHGSDYSAAKFVEDTKIRECFLIDDLLDCQKLRNWV